jgi:hypothetical protein
MFKATQENGINLNFIVESYEFFFLVNGEFDELELTKEQKRTAVKFLASCLEEAKNTFPILVAKPYQADGKGAKREALFSSFGFVVKGNNTMLWKRA